MVTIFDLITANAIASYWQTLHSNTLPMLGAALFPNRRMQGIKLEWIKGYEQLPVMLMPSAFDAKPVLRDRGTVITENVRMPFFRESMRIGENDRQQLMQLTAAGQQYVQPILDRLFDDSATLISSAEINPEVMRFELLQDGTIAIQTPGASGIAVNYNYNYDQSGDWHTNNVISVGVNWDLTGSNPIADILALKRQAASKGKVITRAITSPTVWGYLLASEPIRADVFPLNADASLGDAELMRFILAKTGIQFTVYEKMYKDLDGNEHPFMRDDRVIFLPSNAVGSTYYGTTPEEADLMAGNVDANVSIVGGGIAVATKTESLPVNIITWVSEIVLPSFENMDEVYNLIVK